MLSLAASPLKLLRERAKRCASRNLSAAIAEAAELLRRDIAMGDLVAELERSMVR